MDDILDIDELTKDDSFFSLDDKDHDVCNIIQQWKNKQQQQQQKLAQQQFQAAEQQTPNNDNAYRVNSRTFTRPKRKSAAQNLETQFNGISEQQQQCQTPQYPLSLDTNISNTPMLNVQIGGKIRTPLSARSMLQDTLPPSFMDVSPIQNGISEQQQQQCQTQQYPLSLDTKITNTPMLNVQIGRKVRTPLSARSMLQDTSPPSYMDVSLGGSPMDNSLVTSADFTNIDFLLSTPSLDANAYTEKFDNGAGPPRYTLNDMINDRKALESLTLSGDDGTFIKDSQIAQFDDISLALCKVSSGSSTMGNSTESVEGNSSSNGGNCTMILAGGDETYIFGDRTIKPANVTYTGGDGTDQSGTLKQIMVLSNEEMISDTTYSLIENGQSFIIEREEKANAETLPQLNKTHDVVGAPTAKSSPLTTAAWNETVCIQNNNNNNDVDEQQRAATADTTNNDNELPNLPGTPEKFRKPIKSISTPHTTSRYNNMNTYFPSVNMIREDINISPIVANNEVEKPRPQSFALAEPQNTTFQTGKTSSKPTTANSDTYIGSPLSHLSDEMEMLENIEMPSPNESFHQRRRSCTRLLSREYELEQQQEQQHQQLQQQQLDFEQERLDKSTIEMQDVMDLVEAEAELLAAAGDDLDDETNFDHMLDELGRVELNAEQLKMKKSVETIKKRFNCTLNGGICEREPNAFAGYESASSKTFTSETREEALRHLRDEMSRNRINDATTNALQSSREIANSSFSTASNSSMATSGGSSGERLLSRRSRLYDDINLSTLATSQEVAEPATTTTTTLNTTIAPMVQTTAEVAAAMNEKTEGSESLEAAKYKLPEKRERDRDRFKTMKIVKNANSESDGSASQSELNVPCIDSAEMNDVEVPDETTMAAMQQQQRYSRRDLSNADAGAAKTRTLSSKLQSNTNFLTFKKPKEATKKLHRPEVVDVDHNKLTVVAPKLSSEVRSLSRPRYISGLQKCSVVSKAVSAGDLEKTEHNAAVDPSSGEGKTTQLSRLQTNARKVAAAGGVAINATQTTKSELKSPMGLKAKSLHNLSSNMTYAAYNSGIAAPTRIGSYGLRKINSGGINSTAEQQNQPGQLQKTSSNLARTQKTAAGGSQQSQSNQAFKKPQRPSGLKPTTPGATGTRSAAAGIARPSSGYYSLNAVPKAVAQHYSSDDVKASRSITTINDGKHSNNAIAVTNEPNQLTRITVGASGIPKPSGLRAPTKRSGLPVPSSGVRR